MAQTSQNGESTYLVLDSLSEGAKYGLEIIEHISHRTGGGYIMKKPTLYSSLTRMEKKGLISSSYWGDSDIGGKRHYYILTETGKKLLEELSVEYSNKKFDNGEYSYEEETKHAQTENDPQKTMVLQQENLFNLAQQNEKSAPSESKEEEKTANQNALENQIDFFSYESKQPESVNADPSKDNGIFLDNSERIETFDQQKFDYYQSKLEQKSTIMDSQLTTEQEEQNRRLYDTSSELKKYRKRKSFSENQIEMAVSYDKFDEEEQQKHIQELKNSLLNARNNHVQSQTLNETENTIQNSTRPATFSEEKFESRKPQEKEEQDIKPEETKDDAVFITSRIQEHEIPVQRKIAPANIEIDVSDDNLPAPKRNANLEPTYKDMMSKLFERKKEKAPVDQPVLPEEPEPEEVASFADYDSLKKYYKSHGIEFKEHSKSKVERVHNTNFLNFVSSVVLFVLSGIGSALVYWIVSATSNLSTSSNFLYYTVPLLFFVYGMYAFLKFKLFASKKASLTYGGVVNWAVFVLGAVVVLVVNVIAGMQYERMGTYLTSLLLPMLALLIALPINYYTRKFLFKKYAK